MTQSNSETKVLVTGASGFIGLHCVLQLLESGYRVRGTLRTPSRADGLRKTLDGNTDVGDRLDFATANLSDDAGWTEAVDGCRYVLHVASPLPREVPKDENELIVPAVDGTLRVLRAAADAGVHRVVLTSSLAAVAYGHVRDGSRTFDENDWSIPEEPVGGYVRSKTLAERAAWDFVNSLPDDKKLELVAINPGIVLGPILNDDYGTSRELVRKLMARELPGCPLVGWAPVDVRDVASAHLAAMTTPEAAGKRFCCAIDHAWMSEIAEILDKNFSSRGYRIPTRHVPNFVIRIFAIFDKAAKLAIGDLGNRQDISNAQIKEILGWKPRSLEEMVVAMGNSLIEHGVVQSP